MIKKKITIGIVIVLVLLSISVAYCEPFTIRNGIVIGDSIGDVMGKETLPLKPSDDSDEVTVISTERAIVAGVENTEIYYSFGEDGKLYRVTFQFNSGALDDFQVMLITSVEAYSQVEKILDEKWGDALSDKEKSVYPKTASLESIEDIYSGMQLLKVLGKGEMFLDMSSTSRVVEIENGVVRIDHYVVAMEDVFMHTLAYQFFEAEQSLNSTGMTNEL